MSSITLADLEACQQPSLVWLNDFLKTRAIEKTQVSAVAVSLQLLIGDLFEEMDIVTSQLNSVSAALIRSQLAPLEEQLEKAKRDAFQTAAVPADFAESAGRVKGLLDEIRELHRARVCIQQVSDRLHQVQTE